MVRDLSHLFTFLLKILNVFYANIRTIWASRHDMSYRRVSQNNPGDNLQLHRKSMQRTISVTALFR